MSTSLTANKGWRDRAACLDSDPDLFFPKANSGSAIYAAKRVCADCPVATACLEEALPDAELQGVWGGLSWMERRKLRMKMGMFTTTGQKLRQNFLDKHAGHKLSSSNPSRCLTCHAKWDRERGGHK